MDYLCKAIPLVPKRVFLHFQSLLWAECPISKLLSRGRRFAQGKLWETWSCRCAIWKSHLDCWVMRSKLSRHHSIATFSCHHSSILDNLENNVKIMKRKLFVAENIIGGRINEAVRTFELCRLIGRNYILHLKARASTTPWLLTSFTRSKDIIQVFRP